MLAVNVQLQPAPMHYVYSKVLTYQNCTVQRQKAVHTCTRCSLLHRPGDKHLGKCEAVHHGYCAPVLPSRVTRPAAPPTGVSKHRTTLRSTKPGKPKLHILRQGGSIKTVPEDVSLRERDLNVRITNKTESESSFLKQKEVQLREKKLQEGKERVNNNNRNEPKENNVKVEAKKKIDFTDALSSRLSGALSNIEQFHFPLGKPTANTNEQMIQKAQQAFNKLENGKAYKNNMATIMKACGLPSFWKQLIFRSAGGEKVGHVTYAAFQSTMKRLFANCYDDAARFVRLCAKPGCTYLQTDDLAPLVQDVVESHPGLTFLQDSPEFHSRYVHTVIARIFYSVNRSWTGKITMQELRNSCLLQTIRRLEEVEDINQISQFFSYEHFYVIYCKFWEVDKDHDLCISKEDLARHNDHVISSRMIDRIFSGAVTRGTPHKEGKMSYAEFVWFLMSEEDKAHPTSIEYWFRCMDLDGDGFISMYEMEYFYEEQIQKMESLGIETIQFEDCVCQMLDLVSPAQPDCVSLRDLKRCQMASIFFNTFFNLDKYLDMEQRDPFSNLKDGDEPEMSDWERYAMEEYEILVAEEGDASQLDEMAYEDDFEEDEELAAIVDDPDTMLGPAATH